MLIRLLILVGYVVAAAVAQRYMLHNPPKIGAAHVHPVARNFHFILALAMPLITPLSVYLWIDYSPLHPAIIVILAVLLPVCLLYIPWMRVMKVPTHPFFILVMSFVVVFSAAPILYWLLLAEGKSALTFSLLPLLFFILAPPAFTLALLYHWAPRMLPLSPAEIRTSHHKAAQLLTGFLTTGPRPAVMIVDRKLETRIQGNPFVGTGPGLLITEPEYAVVRYQGTSVKDVIGPGVIFIERGEIPKYVMDLQGQFRPDKGITAQTRDNIEVLVPCSSIFKLKDSKPPTQPGVPWEYDRNAALQAYLAAEVNPDKRATPLDAHEAHSWTKLPLQEASHHLRHLVKRYSLDELYAIIEPRPGELPRLTIAREVRQHVEQQMANNGIKVYGGGVGNRIIPADPTVVEQRIENWKAHKLHILESNRGKIKAEYVREQGRARSDVLRELLELILQQYNTLQQTSAQARLSFIVLQLLETLDKIAQQPEVKASLSKPTSEILTVLQRRAREED